jgi:hypothetical protein
MLGVTMQQINILFFKDILHKVATNTIKYCTKPDDFTIQVTIENIFKNYPIGQIVVEKDICVAGDAIVAVAARILDVSNPFFVSCGGRFCVRPGTALTDGKWFPLFAMCNTVDFLKTVEKLKLSEKEKDRLDELAVNLFNYKLPYIELV